MNIKKIENLQQHSYCKKLVEQRCMKKKRNGAAKFRILTLLISLGVLAIFFHTNFLAAQQVGEKKTFTGKIVSGAEQLQLGLSTASILYGGASIGLLGGGDVLIDNPAAAARNLRHSLILQGTGLNDRRTGMLLGYAHVTQWGVLSGYTHVLMGYKSGYEIGEMYSFSFAFSKLISTIYEFGFRVTADYFDPAAYALNDEYINRRIVSNFGVSVDLAFNVQPSLDFSRGVFTFRNFRYGFSIRNAGWLPQVLGDDGVVAYGRKMDLFRMGGGFDFLLVKDREEKPRFVSRLAAEAGLSYPIAGSFSTGIENKIIIEKGGFRSISLHLGYLFDSSLSQLLPVIPGISLEFFTKNAEIAVRNAFFIEKNSRNRMYDQLSSSLSLEVRFGNLDENPPEINTDYFGTEGLIEIQ